MITRNMPMCQAMLKNHQLNIDFFLEIAIEEVTSKPTH